uniref:Zinc finger protein 32 n=1 Tax=Aceria tosichella TaxID=561515 RepID=A0A6G1S780_9ACAR
MDFNHNVRFKTVYPHSHINIYNAPVINASMPSITLAPGLNLVSATAKDPNNTNYEGNHLSALATLQVSSATSSLSLPATAQLVPVNTLDSLQLQQMQQHTYIDQANQITKSNNQFLQVQIANPTPTMAQNNPVAVSHNQAQVLSNGGHETVASNKKSFNPVEGAKSEQTPPTKPGESSSVSSTTQLKKSFNQNNNVKYQSPGDNSMHDFSNKFAIINNGKGFRCLVCNREFTQKGNLKTHALTHLGPTERPYDCETCGRRFTQKGNRDIHVKIHTGTKDHTCPYCDRGFTQRGNLKTHIRSVHTGEKPYSCGHCGKAFSQKANMLTHFRTHDKNSRFSCNTCGKTFSQKGNLKTHQQRHVQVSGS